MNQIDTTKVTRVEVIDDDGRSYTKWNVFDVQIMLQDDNRTLKVFLKENKNEN